MIDTRLPRPTVQRAEQTVPQHGPVAWAFAAGRALITQPTTATLVLAAYALHAQSALFGGDGYTVTTTDNVAALTGLSTSTVRRHTAALVERALLHYAGTFGSSGYRIPDAVIDGTWID